MCHLPRRADQSVQYRSVFEVRVEDRPKFAAWREHAGGIREQPYGGTRVNGGVNKKILHQ